MGLVYLLFQYTCMHTQWFMVNLPLCYYEKKWLSILEKEILKSLECLLISLWPRYHEWHWGIQIRRIFFLWGLTSKKETIIAVTFYVINHFRSFNWRFKSCVFYKLYDEDKRDNFPFQINRISYLDSSIPPNTSCVAMDSELHRFAKTTTLFIRTGTNKSRQSHY